MSTWLPQDTKQALRQGASLEPGRCESRLLLLFRMPSSPGSKDESANARMISLERALKPAAPPVASNQLRWLANLSRAHSFSLWTDQRLVMGLANGVLENAGLDLHPFFGTPIISGSKLKGIAADASRQLVKEGRFTTEDQVTIFGNVNEIDGASLNGGCVSFLAAHPARADCRLELDVLTVHYPAYYTGGGTDWDTDSPIPSPFPAVAEEQEFVFHLLCRSPRVAEADAPRLLQAAAACLRHALIHHGVGGKTRAGYGRFRETKLRVAPNQPADDLFTLTPTVEAVPMRALADVAPGSGSAVDAFVAQWTGDTLVPDRIKKFAEALRKLPVEQRLAAFDRCVPRARRTFDDPLWSGFKSRRQGIDLLKELRLD